VSKSDWPFGWFLGRRRCGAQTKRVGDGIGPNCRLDRHEDLPMKRLSELFNVNHFVVSQMNPHLVPLLWWTSSRSRSRLGHKVMSAVAAEVIHRVRQLVEFGPWCVTKNYPTSLYRMKWGTLGV
jgi:hypothetical protein